MVLNKYLSVFISLTLLNGLFAGIASGQEIFDITITNIKKNAGIVVVEIYNNKVDWLKTPFKMLELSTIQDVQIASFNVPYGSYAISIYQDLNSNAEPDMNFLSIPKEPIGFGNNYKPFGEPKFDSCLIEFSATYKPQVIKMYEVF